MPIPAVDLRFRAPAYWNTRPRPGSERVTVEAYASAADDRQWVSRGLLDSV